MTYHAEAESAVFALLDLSGRIVHSDSPPGFNVDSCQSIGVIRVGRTDEITVPAVLCLTIGKGGRLAA